MCDGGFTNVCACMVVYARMAATSKNTGFSRAGVTNIRDDKRSELDTLH
jgi:hypothetical protein